MTLAVVGHCDHFVHGFLAIPFTQLLKQGAGREFLPVVEVAEHIRCTSDGDRAVRASGEQLAGIDQINGT